MDPIRENLFSVLNFTPGEKRGLYVVILLMIITWQLPLIISYFKDPEDEIAIRSSYVSFVSAMDEKSAASDESKKQIVTYIKFDPNVVSPTQLEQMNFPPFIISRIMKYRNSGGEFRTKEDLKKIYGLSPNLYAKVEKYIVLKEPVQIENKVYPEKTVLNLNLNLADSAGLESLQGIGPVFAKRIITYREALGGFIGIQQLKEVYGMTDDIYEKIRSQSYLDTFPQIKKIKINTVLAAELRKHPYFRKAGLAEAIVNYRKAHGYYQDLSDLGEIKIFSDSLLVKTKPYIDLNE